MEGAPIFEKPNNNEEESFRDLKLEAEVTAREYLAGPELIGLEGDEWMEAMIDLMRELEVDNGNRFIVEALARELKYYELKKRVTDFEEAHEMAA